MKLLKSLSLYTISGLSSKAAGFLVLPIVANTVGRDNMGILSLIYSITGVVAPLILLSASAAISVEYYREDFGKKAFSSYLSSALTNPLLSFGLFVLFFLIFGKYLAEFIGLDPKWMSVIPFYCLVILIPSVISVIYQVTNQPLKHVTFNVGMVLTEMALAILLVVALKWNYDGRIWSIIGSKLAFTLIGLYLLYRSGLLTRKISKVYRQDAWKFAFPLIPYYMASSVVNFSDRIFIKLMESSGDLGVYAIGYKIGSVVMILQAAFALAWMPFLYELIKRNTEQARRKIVLYTYAGMAGFILAVLGVTLLAPLALYLFNSEYQGGLAYVFWVALGYGFMGWYSLRVGFVLYFKKNIYLTYIAFVKIIINLLLNYFLIKHYGVVGAAYATAISFFIEFLMTHFVCRSIYSLPWFYFLNRSKKV